MKKLTTLLVSTTLYVGVGAKKITCLPEPEAYMQAVNTVCQTNADCIELLSAGQASFYSCLNGNDGGQPGDASSCYEFARTVLPKDPHMKKVTDDIVLWSGVTPEQQESFLPQMRATDGDRIPLLLGATWGSKVTAAFETFDWDNMKKCQVKTDATPNQCIPDCGWNQGSTLKPWEALSRWLAEHAAKSPMASSRHGKGGGAKAYLLLNHFSNSNVFSRIELPTLVREMFRDTQKLLELKSIREGESDQSLQKSPNTMESMKKTFNDITQTIKAGVKVLSVRIAKGAIDKSQISYNEDGTSSPIVRPPGMNDPLLTCATVIDFIQVVEASEKLKYPSHGSAMLCVKCFSQCDSNNFRVNGHGGSCEETVEHHCLRKKLVKAASKLRLQKIGEK